MEPNVAQDAAKSLLRLLNAQEDRSKIPKPSVLTHEKGVNVKSGDIVSPFIDIIDTDSKLNSVTGLPSFELLNVLVKRVKMLRAETSKQSLTHKERIILTLFKLKENLSFSLLAIFFKVTPSTCKNIFEATIKDLSIIMKATITWPDRKEIQLNLPVCFNNFTKTRVVVDYTEIPVMKPKCKELTYSQCKGGHTVKYLIGVTPAGLISEVSKGYGGGISDSVLFEESDLLRNLDAYSDAVMVDKDLLIRSFCEASSVEVIQPPPLKKKRCSKSESDKTLLVTRARAHVKRAIQRLKLFKILSNTVSWNLLPLLDSIVTVAACVTNLSAPVLSNERF